MESDPQEKSSRRRAPGEELQEGLQEKSIMSTTLRERVKGALFRSTWRKWMLQAPFSSTKHMICLQLLDGIVITRPEEMRANTRSFYGNLFEAEHCSLENFEEILECLPQLRTIPP